MPSPPKGVLFLFFHVITYALLPTSTESDFSVFFFPRVEKKKRTEFLKFERSQKKSCPYNLKKMSHFQIFLRFFFSIPRFPREKKNGKICSYLPTCTSHRRNYMLLPGNKKTIPLWFGLLFRLVLLCLIQLRWDWFGLISVGLACST